MDIGINRKIIDMDKKTKEGQINVNLRNVDL